MAGNPGPGAYSHSRSSSTGPSFGFGTSVRTGLGTKVTNPGPGTYNGKPVEYPTKIGMTPRRPLTVNPRDVNPGPGSYNHKLVSQQNAPSYGQGTSMRTNLVKSLSPGPGQYSPGSKPNPGVQFTKDLK